MLEAPRVSIVMPVFNDAQWIEDALESCLAQTLSAVEVIVVDDASTDETASIVERLMLSDTRVRLIRQDTNRTAFQARKAGIASARAPYVMFLDGDDTLTPQSAEIAERLARDEQADVVGFGVQIVTPDGSTGGDYESALQPRIERLEGPEILEKLFPVGKTAQGQLWRYLFTRNLLNQAYGSLPSRLALPRANDIPIAFLALMNARKYVSTSAVLYRYFFRRGASGHDVETVEDYHFAASAIDSIESISPNVAHEANVRINGIPLLKTYQSARLSIVGRVLNYVQTIADDELRHRCIALLTKRVGQVALAAAAADFSKKSVALLVSCAAVPELGDNKQHVLIRVSNLGTGGAQGVAVAQARYMLDAGFSVTIATDSPPQTHFRLPAAVRLIQLKGDSLGQRVQAFADLCIDLKVDVIVDHYIFYNESWPYFALAAAGLRIPTIGWLHNFALRPIADGTTRTSFLDRTLPLLATLVVLSPVDVAYWKMRGLRSVNYLPNPPSPLLSELSTPLAPRKAPSDTLKIVWWGRLQQSTKQVRELIEIAALLKDIGVKFRLKIIGPDSPDLTAQQLRDLALRLDVVERVATLGPLHGKALVNAIKDSDVLLSTSTVEGYPLAHVEAYALGLPVLMYDLPWLATLADSSGVVRVPQGDRRAAALALARLGTEPETYMALSSGAVRAARAALDHDFEFLYTKLVTGGLPADYSPEPTVADCKILLNEIVRFTETLITKQQGVLAEVHSDSYTASLLRERDRAVRKLRQVTNGPSFRLGRAITYVPRKVYARAGQLRLRSALQRFGKSQR